jgi:phosphohistidine swiveling domain-containing protein
MQTTLIQNSFLTKAETLALMKDQIEEAKVLPLAFFSVEDWRSHGTQLLENIISSPELTFPLVARSSSRFEDTLETTNAGVFTSVLNISSSEQLKAAIETVIASYPKENLNCQVLVQPQLLNVKVSGVIFTKDPNTHGDYLIINYDNKTFKTDTITSGVTNNLECFVHHKLYSKYPEGWLKKVVLLAQELESFFSSDSLDIEFAIDEADQLYLFQVRPLIIKTNSTISVSEQIRALSRISHKIESLSKKHPYLYGTETLFGVMPDWNPAEIIGIRPKPLALSLYRELVTDSVWAYQRNNYGYRNLRSFPLLVDFEGLPYIDLRVSFNSFTPKNLPAELSERLINTYIQILKNDHTLHDKIEFEVVFSCYTFSLRTRLEKLTALAFSKEDIETIFKSLNSLTQNIVLNDSALWKKDLKRIEQLKENQNLILGDTSLDTLSKIYWLIEDCKRYGVLPFAGLARVGFIAVEILKSLVENQIFTKSEYDTFFGSVRSISSEIFSDFQTISKEVFLEKYGHLRPGTYDILSPSYEEDPELYFNWDLQPQVSEHKKDRFNLSLEQLRKIQEILNSDGWEINVLDFLEFIKIAIESREYAKFVFTKSIHHALKLLSDYCSAFSFSKDETAFLNIQTILDLYSRSYDPYEALLASIEKGKKHYELTKVLNLPPILVSKEAPFSFHQTIISPNYITQKEVEGETVSNYLNESLKDKIVFIPSADPGFDWIFLKSIKGLVTMYGGVNSHMAIRSNELGIPAIIGAGELNFSKWGEANRIKLDCLNKTVTVLQ